MRKPYDKKKIGKFIGWGGEHVVFAYDSDKVIKFSLHVWLSGRSAVEKIKTDYAAGQRYFASYLLPTEILVYKDGRACAEIQPKIACRFLERKDLESPLIKRQFDDIMSRYQRMERETGLVFDLFGREGLFRFRPQFISNILVTSEDKLVLIDFTLLYLEKIKWRELPILLIIKWAAWRQRKLLKSFIN
jgi:hypothetical protein